jgi:CarboxypepD_reg-like domain
MKNTILLLTITVVLALGAQVCSAQSVYLSGYTRDSTTFDLLPYVSIYGKKSAPLASSNENGYFSLRINPGDTIVFTRLGYKPVKIAPDITSWDMNVLMPETIHVLDQVIVYDKYIIHGHEQIQKSLRENAEFDSSPFKNQTAAPVETNLIQTFGAGLVLNGVLSKLLGTDREQRKVSANKAELIRTQVYYEVVQSNQVKQYLMGIFNLSEDDYIKDLERFKVDYPTAVYLKSREEIIRLMVESFTRSKK